MERGDHKGNGDDSTRLGMISCEGSFFSSREEHSAMAKWYLDPEKSEDDETDTTDLADTGDDEVIEE
jgi:hypothetical protein